MSNPETSLELQALADRATAALEKAEAQEFPVVIEFSGSPKAGKTTNIEIVEHFFKRSKFKVWAPTEGASKRTPYHLRRDLVAYNCWSLNYAISELLVAYNNVDKQHLVILDRGPFDSLAWMTLLMEKGKLEEKEFETIKNFALHPKWMSTIKRIYLFTCDPEISLVRENNFKLIRRAGIAMNREMLSRLQHQYKSLGEGLQKYPLYKIDTSKSTKPIETAFGIADDILKIFEAM